jgi:tetratricopeptide (TPR) repeat protein
MTIASAEKKLDGVEQKGNSSDDGDIRMRDASNDQISATAWTQSPPECASASGPASSLPSPTDRPQGPQENGSNSDLITPWEWKKTGNEYFGAEDWIRALHAYYSGLSALLKQRQQLALRNEHEGDNNSEWPSTSTSTSTSTTAEVESNLNSSSTPDPLEVALRSNIAFVLIKLQRYDRAQEECNQLLSISPLNCKGTMKIIPSRVNDCLLCM